MIWQLEIVHDRDSQLPAEKRRLCMSSEGWTQLVDILNTHSGCRGVIFDQPQVLSEAIEHDRVERVAGSFFENIPVEEDAYILPLSTNGVQ
jgi:hypothetical protein